MFLPLVQLTLLALFAKAAPQKLHDLIVNTSSGLVKGYLDTGTTSDVPLLKWLGIRYAQDTSGHNRWRPPQPVHPSDGLFDASKYGPACLQGRSVFLS
jgi:carboxylesterase type B